MRVGVESRLVGTDNGRAIVARQRLSVPLGQALSFDSVHKVMKTNILLQGSMQAFGSLNNLTGRVV
jgi:hypothetical protein